MAAAGTQIDGVDVNQIRKALKELSVKAGELRGHL
jgi:hypothetical protein